MNKIFTNLSTGLALVVLTSCAPKQVQPTPFTDCVNTMKTSYYASYNPERNLINRADMFGQYFVTPELLCTPLPKQYISKDNTSR